MQKSRLLVLLGLPLTFSLLYPGSPVLAAAPATPAFTIAATNVTMSSSTSTGTGSSSLTITSVNGYTGTIGIICGGPTYQPGITVPACNFGGPAVIAIVPLTANQVATATIAFDNTLPCNPCPVSLPRRGGRGQAPALALAGALLLGFGIRRRAARWLTLTLLAAGTLAGLAAIGACGGSSSGRVVTPGTYAYTITARDMNANTSVSTTINLTVP
jgi:hypothetical protein